jgi:hypothetical protein
MAIKKERMYRRLPGSRLTRYTLWQASDHLLQVEGTGFAENYSRFYFRDIQAMIMQPSHAGRTLNIILLALIGSSGILALLPGDEFDIFWWVVAGIFAAAWLYNQILGPTCICYLETAVKRYRLRSLSRSRFAERLIARLRPVIQAAQEF